MIISATEILLIIAIIALIIFFAMKKSVSGRKINRHNALLEKQDELIQMLREKHNKEQNPEVSDTTEAK